MKTTVSAVGLVTIRTPAPAHPGGSSCSADSSVSSYPLKSLDGSPSVILIPLLPFQHWARSEARGVGEDGARMGQGRGPALALCEQSNFRELLLWLSGLRA